MDTMELKPRRAWRRHGAEFKAGVIEACRQPGGSVASVALAHGLNANLLRNWLATAGKPVPVKSASIEPGFLPLAMPPPTPAQAAISIEIRLRFVGVRRVCRSAGRCTLPPSAAAGSRPG